MGCNFRQSPKASSPGPIPQLESITSASKLHSPEAMAQVFLALHLPTLVKEHPQEMHILGLLALQL